MAKDAALQIVEHGNQRILTTEQLAEEYGTTILRIQQNYKANKDRYVLGKHYFFLEGAQLKAFKDLLGNSLLVDKRAPSLYLWTEKGALLHAKSLGTDKAWEKYEELVDTYFRLREQAQLSGPNHEISLRLYATYECLEERVLDGYWSIITELCREVHLAELAGNLDGGAFPEISVGKRWARYARETLDIDVDNLPKYQHYNPLADYKKEFQALLYPLSLQRKFRYWFRDQYLPFECKIYIANRERRVTRQIGSPANQKRMR